MPGFAESFWTEDYATGVSKLFAKLHQGVAENEEVLNLARRRADAEETHGNRLQQMARDALRKDGFAKDDGASIRRAFEGMTKESTDTGKHHVKIATNLQDMVIKPFGKWTHEHALRVQSSEKELMSKIKIHEKHASEVKKLRSTYFNKCRLLEDFEEENKLAFPTPDQPGTPTKSTKRTPEEIAADLNAVLDDEPVELGETFYSAAQMKVLLETMLDTLPMKEVKMPILGTFEHVSSGSTIVDWIHKNMGVSSLGAAETVGQDLLNNGYIRYLGVGNTFANSSVLNYQWKDKALIAAGKIKAGTTGIASRAAAMPYVGEYVSTYVSNEYANETPQGRLIREADQSNEAYKAAVKNLDGLRTDMEATIMEHLRFMERCELDRLKALKAVMMDVSAAISNIIPGMKSAIDTMLLFQESISPSGDLKYMIESYRSGNFAPKVITYENYYNTVEGQTFGVDLELRARQDRKRVPNIVATILSHMDEYYPGLATDVARQKVWLRTVPLHLIHQLRQEINTGKNVDKEVLKEFDTAIVAATLKLYFLELPDSLVSKTLYEPIKAIYLNYGTKEDDEDRVSALSNVLQQLRVSNIATLDAIAIHFARLIELTNADEECKYLIANTLAPCVLRPRVESSLTLQDKHPVRLVSDLLEHRRTIFETLKRASTTRPRSATDEKDRRIRMEERNRAISLAGRRPSGAGLPVTQLPLPPSSLRNESQPHDPSTISSGQQEIQHNTHRADKQQTPPPSQATQQRAPHTFTEQDLAFNPESLPVANEAPQIFDTSESFEKKPSLTRSVVAGNRISRHGKPESRNLTGEPASNSPTSNRQSVQLHDAPVSRPNSQPQAEVEYLVQGVSLKDGNIDYD